MAPEAQRRRVTGASRYAAVCCLLSLIACTSPPGQRVVTHVEQAPAPPVAQPAGATPTQPSLHVEAPRDDADGTQAREQAAANGAASSSVPTAEPAPDSTEHAPAQEAKRAAPAASIDDLLSSGLSAPRRAAPPGPPAGVGDQPTLGLGLHGTGRGGGGVGYGFGSVGLGSGVARVQAMQIAPMAPVPSSATPGAFNTESYAQAEEAGFVSPTDQPLSTFSIDVDTASYSNVRRFLNEGSLPPSAAVRVEEMLNYFRYTYPAPSGEHPFTVHTEVASAPWAPDHRLLLVGMQARRIEQAQTPPRNLVFLVDVSGSMESPDKLPLLKSGLTMLARQLREQDRISIVVYAGASGVVLDTTHGADQAAVIGALERLQAGGSTNGGEGIELAYQMATRSFIRGGVNRVILATDGDFNVGVTSEGELKRLIEDKRQSGVFLSVLGFGRGNLQDSTMEMLADKGNGNYAYIDSMREAHRALVREAGATLVTLAKDVKLQVELNPAHVAGYRLIGYDNRRLAAQDFNDDRKDAGEMGAGHSVTALYEIIPHGAGGNVAPAVDPLRYQNAPQPGAAHTDELATVKVRYKRPDAEQSTRFDLAVRDAGQPIGQASENLRWAAAVASFGMVLAGSDNRGNASLGSALSLAEGAVAQDEDRSELIDLIRKAQRLQPDQALHVAR